MKDKVLKTADGLLQALGRLTGELQQADAEMAREIERVKLSHEVKIIRIREEMAARQKELIGLARTEAEQIFGKVDSEEREVSRRVDLKNGALLYSIEQRVKRARSVTPEKLEELGFALAVRTAKSVNWDELEKWDDAMLEKAGTERIEKRRFEYELNPEPEAK